MRVFSVFESSSKSGMREFGIERTFSITVPKRSVVE